MGKVDAPTTKDAIEVRCSFDELVAPVELTPHPQNPNHHPAKQLELYSKIVRYQGFRRAVTVSRRSGWITRGNGLWEMASLERLQEIPVDYQDYDSEEQELADVLADNLLHELAELNREKTDAILEKLNTGDFDLELSGLPQFELEKRLPHENEEGLSLSFGGAVNETSGEGGGSTTPDTQSAALSLAQPPSAVKCIQFFIEVDKIPAYEMMVRNLQAFFKTDNPSDTIMESLRRSLSLFTTGA